MALGSGGVKATCHVPGRRALRPESDNRRDAGFSLFYLGINLGALPGDAASPRGCSRTRLGFHWGFGARCGRDGGRPDPVRVHPHAAARDNGRRRRPTRSPPTTGYPLVAGCCAGGDRGGGRSAAVPHRCWSTPTTAVRRGGDRRERSSPSLASTSSVILTQSAPISGGGTSSRAGLHPVVPRQHGVLDAVPAAVHRADRVLQRPAAQPRPVLGWEFPVELGAVDQPGLHHRPVGRVRRDLDQASARQAAVDPR